MSCQFALKLFKTILLIATYGKCGPTKGHSNAEVENCVYSRRSPNTVVVENSNGESTRKDCAQNL